MPQEGGQEQTALLTIIQLLIEQGVPSRTSRRTCNANITSI
jgi:hypothetical protein